MHIAIRSFKYVLAGFCLAIVFTARVLGADGPLTAEGVIKKDTTWSGVVIVASDVLVPEGVTLTIAPGTKVLFAMSDSSKIEPMFLSMQTELLVRGKLMAQGEKDRPVRFGPATDAADGRKPQRGDWGGVIFDGEASSGSVVAGAEFAMADTGVSVYHSSPRLAGCRIDDCRYGIVCAGGSRPEISGCTVRSCEYGVVSIKRSRPVLAGCKVEKNERDFLTRD